MRTLLFLGFILVSFGGRGQDVSLSAYRPSDGAIRALTAPDVKLNYQPMRVAPGTAVPDILKQNGIYVDGESLGLVYELNPALDSGRLPVGEKINVPVPLGGHQWEAAQREGFLLAVTNDMNLKRKLFSEADALKSVGGRFESSKAVSTLGPREQKEVLDALSVSEESVSALRTVIEKRNRPVMRAVIEQATNETQALNAIMARSLETARPLSAADRRTFALVAENMQVRSEILREVRGPGQLPDRWPMVSVLVRTKFAGGRDAHSLRIYYQPQALYGDDVGVETFDTLSTPSEGSVPPANYMFWAGAPGNPKPKSDVLKVSARKRDGKKPLVVELQVRKK